VTRRLLDTSACVWLIRRRSGAMLERLCRCPVRSVGLSSITLAELRYGVARSSNPRRNAIALARFIAPLEILDFGPQAARSYGRLRAALEHAGTPIGPLDTLIAAHALAERRTLVSSNEREFRRVPGLRVENWLTDR